MLGSEQLDPQSINQRFSRQCKEAANRHFADLVPPRIGEDDLYMHLFRAIYATLAVYYYCPPRVNGILFKAEIQGHRMIASTTDQETLRSYTASRHYDDYAIADPNGNVDGRRGLRLGEPGVQVLQVLQTTPPTEPVSTAPTKAPMPKPKTQKSTKLSRPEPVHWRISEAAHGILSKDWTLDNEHQSDALDRVLAFATVAKKLAGTMELPVGQIAPDALLAAATTRFEALSGNLKATVDQMAQLKAQHDAAQRTIALLTSERDALSARLTTLQAEFQDAATRHAPPVELLHSLAASSNSPLCRILPTAELQSSLMRLAIDAITQAEGAPPAAVAPPPVPAPPAAIAPPATPPPTPPTQTQPPQPPPTPQQPAQPTQQPQIVTPQTAPTTTPMPDGQTPTDTTDRRQCCRRPARREKSQHRQGRSETRKGAGIPCHPQHHRHRQTRQMGR